MTQFLEPDEERACRDFLEKGFVVRPAQDTRALEQIQRCVAGLAAGYLGIPAPVAHAAFLDGIHRHVAVGRLNEFRLHVFNGMAGEPWFRPAYFSCGRALLETIVGNELCMQRRVNLSIQLPADDSSVLPIHADVLSGDSPFEVVLWIPLVDCYRTKAMFLAPPKTDEKVKRQLGSLSRIEDAFRLIENEVVYVDVPFGHVLVFNQNLMHGNRVNVENETRWSMNCRFKSILSPYSDKKLGEFFEPITLRPATRVGMSYRPPGGFDER